MVIKSTAVHVWSLAEFYLAPTELAVQFMAAVLSYFQDVINIAF